MVKSVISLAVLGALIGCSSPTDTTTPPPTKTTIDPDTVVSIVDSTFSHGYMRVETYRTWRVDTTINGIHCKAVMEYRTTFDNLWEPTIQFRASSTSPYYKADSKACIKKQDFWREVLWYIGSPMYEIMITSDSSSNFPRGDYSKLADGE